MWFKYNISMTTLFMNQIISTLFPTCLLWLLAYSTLFINVANFNNRFMGSVTSLLVLASLLGAINSGLPKTSYFKYIDLWFLWYITNIFLIIISHIVIDNVSNETTIEKVLLVKSKNSNHIPIVTNKISKRRFINRVAMMIFPLLTICFNVMFLKISMS